DSAGVLRLLVVRPVSTDRDLGERFVGWVRDHSVRGIAPADEVVEAVDRARGERARRDPLVRTGRHLREVQGILVSAVAAPAENLAAVLQGAAVCPARRDAD